MTSNYKLLDRFLTPTGTAIERFGWPNGLQLIYYPDLTVPVFSYHTWFKVGSKDEEPGRTGLAHMFEHLMFKETSHRPEGEFDKLMEAAGGNTNAATWVDWTYFQNALPAGNLAMCVELEADRLAHMVISQAQLTSEREVVLNERSYRVDDDPDERMMERLHRLAFTCHTYGHPTIGWREDIEAYTLEDLLDFHKRYYGPNNATVVVCGQAPRDELLEFIDCHYAGLLPCELRRPVIVEEPKQTAERREVMELEAAAEKILMAWHQGNQSDAERATVDVIEDLLVGGRSSRLYQRLVHQSGLASSVRAMTASTEHPGLLTLAISMRPGLQVSQAEAIVWEELARLQHEPIPVSDLAKARNGVEADFLRDLQATHGRAELLGFYHLVRGDYRHAFEHVQAIQRVRPEDLQRMAQGLFVRDNTTAITGIPRKEALP